MSTLAIRGLKPAQLKALDRQAKHAGKSASEYVRSLIERDLLLAQSSFDEILKPVRASFRKNGVSPEEFDRIVTDARKAIRRRRRPGGRA